jgi:hypothetical protein
VTPSETGFTARRGRTNAGGCSAKGALLADPRCPTSPVLQTSGAGEPGVRCTTGMPPAAATQLDSLTRLRLRRTVGPTASTGTRMRRPGCTRRRRLSSTPLHSTPPTHARADSELLTHGRRRRRTATLRMSPTSARWRASRQRHAKKRRSSHSRSVTHCSWPSARPATPVRPRSPPTPHGKASTVAAPPATPP